ncbi:MAG: pitrilysin family protein [Proteobacteria bacterium]|nr:pitrilysin family protein [Pseudomonadota bacterium]MDA0993071.1 pitrilysin family protein [Pseudomonadota bacterium]
MLTRIMMLLAAILLSACQSKDGPAAGQPSATSTTTTSAFQVPIQYHTLDNGLKVVLSQDKTTPIVTVAVYYNIGFRIEPRERTGFAHLFEHMMFQGSQNLGKMEFVNLVQSNGGVLNGSTRFDYTNYFEIVPSHKLETMLWAEADRMRSLDITQDNLTNQQGVVKNEVKVNVLNTPYGGFPWLDMPQYANVNWYNSHNFYGDLDDLDAASLDDVADFFQQYYAPNNAALAIVGDFEYADALRLVEKYFGAISRSAQEIKLPDISEPRQEAGKRASRLDPQATRPGFAFAYHVPERLTPEWYAMGLLDQILLQGEDSLLNQVLVKNEGITAEIEGGINALLGNMLNYQGPMLWLASFIHDADVEEDRIVAALDGVIQTVQNAPIDAETLQRAKVKWRSSFYNDVSATFGFGRADLLASLALYDDDPERINRFEAEMTNVTPEMIQKTAQEYLRSSNRTILVLEAGASSGNAEVAAND